MEDQKFEVGERVWFQPLGWGVVHRINSGTLYPVCCRFECGDNSVGCRFECGDTSWTETGEFTRGCGIQSLFRANSGVLKFDTKELPDWPKNHPIWVRDCSDGRWVKRHFSYFRNGFAYCFSSGLSEHTASPDGNVEGWRNYTDVDPNKSIKNE